MAASDDNKEARIYEKQTIDTKSLVKVIIYSRKRIFNESSFYFDLNFFI